MASIYKRSNGVFYCKLRDTAGRMQYISLKTTNRKEAQKLRIEIERQLLTSQFGGDNCGDTPLGFDEAWTAYEAGLKHHKKPSSLYNEGSAWRSFSAFCAGRGLVSVQQVRVSDIAAWMSGLLDAKRSAVGVGTYRRMCGIVWNHLIRLEVVNMASPFAKVKAPPAEVQTKFLPWADVQRFVRAAQAAGRDIGLAVVLGAYAGLRKDEILRVRWEHVDWAEGRLFVDGTKTVASRNYVPLHHDLRAALEPFREETGYVVAPGNEGTDAPHSYRWEWRAQWKRAEQATVVDGDESTRLAPSPHQLRHSVATHLLDLGYTIQQVAVFLRHANDVPTRRYASLKGVSLVMDRF